MKSVTSAWPPCAPTTACWSVSTHSFGSFAAQYGSFGSVGEEATLGLGGPKFGNFLSANSERSGRFLDTPEFRPLHDVGNSETIFDRLDWQPNGTDSFHLNLLAARNWFQVPNTLDQPNQDQRQKVLTYNIAPGYQHAFGAGAVLTINTFLLDPDRGLWGFVDQLSRINRGRTFATTPGELGDYVLVDFLNHKTTVRARGRRAG